MTRAYTLDLSTCTAHTRPRLVLPRVRCSCGRHLVYNRTDTCALCQQEQSEHDRASGLLDIMRYATREGWVDLGDGRLRRD